MTDREFKAFQRNGYRFFPASHVRSTEKAILANFGRSRTRWLPKSQVITAWTKGGILVAEWYCEKNNSPNGRRPTPPHPGLLKMPPELPKPYSEAYEGVIAPHVGRR